MEDVVVDRATGKKFIPVSVDSLILDQEVEFDIYIPTSEASPPVLYRAKNQPFDAAAKAKLEQARVSTFYVCVDDVDVYHRYMENNLDKIVADKTLPSSRKAEVVYETSRRVMQDVLNDPRSGENIKRSEKIVTSTVDFILRDKDAFVCLLTVTSYDYYTYTHSLNVCIYTVALAQRTGITDRTQLHQLGTGALLHDVGKSGIDKSILEKKGPLTDEEWVIMKRHPKEGERILRENVDLPEASAVVVTQHHEKCDGSGYPEGLTYDGIHPFARMAALIDVFDALTTRRPYREAMEAFAAMKLMNEEMHDSFDEDIFRNFVLLLGR